MDPLPDAPRLSLMLAAFIASTLAFSASAQYALAQTKPTSTKIQTVVVTDSERIVRLVDAPIPFEPIFGVVGGAQDKLQVLRVFGVRQGEVWISNVENSFVRVTKVGRQIEASDPRLRDYEEAICNGQIVFAYEPLASEKLHPEAILRAERTFYNVKKLADSSFSIEKIGTGE